MTWGIVLRTYVGRRPDGVEYRKHVLPELTTDELVRQLYLTQQHVKALEQTVTQLKARLDKIGGTV